MRSNLRSGVTARAKRALSVAAVAGAAGLSLSPVMALAAEADAAVTTAAADQPTDVEGVDIVGGRTARPSSPKLTADPLDTPQTITVVSEHTIRDQNLLSLRDILSTVPGITFGAGEGGGGYGDSINLRGYSANSDITTDGLRDSAQYSRTDPFNLEQIEVVNGANSVYSGAGSLGGSVNLVSKTPRLGDRTTISAGLGSDSYGRLTIDANKMIGNGIAVRLNAMAHQNDVPGRDVETYERWGIAPSIAFGVGTPTEVSLAYFHQEDENTPEYGVPYASNVIANGPLPGVDRSSYFGYRNMDIQESQVDALTGRFSHEFSETLTISNITRWQKVTQLTLVNPPQGTWCLANGFSAQPSAALVPVACAVPGFFIVGGPRGNTRDSENQQFVSQTDFTLKFKTGGLSHSMVLGFSLSNETYELDTGNSQRTAAGAAPTYPNMSITDPDNIYTGPVNYFRSALSDGELNNQAIYIFDTIALTEQWELNGGLRYEHNEGEFLNTPYTVVGGVATPGVTTRAVSDENLLSYRFGVVYKPVPNASLYLAYGNTQTPSQASVNGGCSVAASNSNCDVEPEEGEVIELGAKWDVFDGRLSLTGSIFQNERSKYRVNSPVANVEQLLDGASRVRGLTLGAAGQINERWTVIANYTYLDSEFLQSVADGVIDSQKGDPLPFTPEHALNLWTTYMVTDDIMIGYGATYAGESTFNRPTGSTVLYTTDDYWIHNAAVTWTATDNVSVQLNIKNLTDEEYYTRIRSSNGFGWATPGDARSAQVTLNYRF